MLAARVLAQVFTRGRSLKAELAWALPKLADSRDRALLEALCFAVLRRRSTYDAALQSWMQKPLSARDADLRTLLMVGFAQLDVLALPAHAALSATVDAARALGRERRAGLVNAILRRAQREGSRNSLRAMPSRRGWPMPSSATGRPRPRRSLPPACSRRRCGCAPTASRAAATRHWRRWPKLALPRKPVRSAPTRCAWPRRLP